MLTPRVGACAQHPCAWTDAPTCRVDRAQGDLDQDLPLARLGPGDLDHRQGAGGVLQGGRLEVHRLHLRGGAGQGGRAGGLGAGRAWRWGCGERRSMGAVSDTPQEEGGRRREGGRERSQVPPKREGGRLGPAALPTTGSWRAPGRQVGPPATRPPCLVQSSGSPSPQHHPPAPPFTYPPPITHCSFWPLLAAAAERRPINATRFSGPRRRLSRSQAQKRGECTPVVHTWDMAQGEVMASG